MLEIHTYLRSQPLQTFSSDFWSSPMSNSPSNDVLSKCLMAGFLQHEELYLREMTSIPIGESISFDHTFKVGTNIGYLREDGRWMKEYDSLFIVLNGKGQVLTWQLTKGTSLDITKMLLQDLVERSHEQIKTIYVDDCCKLRNKIKEIFGQNVTVKLRLISCCSKDH